MLKKKKKKIEGSDRLENKSKHNMLETKRKDFHEREDNHCQML